MKTLSKQARAARLAELRNMRFLVGSNEGTFSAEECCRVTGNGDPRSGTYHVWETPSGFRSVSGRRQRDVGRTMHFQPRELRELREEYNRLVKEQRDYGEGVTCDMCWVEDQERRRR